MAPPKPSSVLERLEHEEMEDEEEEPEHLYGLGDNRLLFGRNRFGLNRAQQQVPQVEQLIFPLPIP